MTTPFPPPPPPQKSKYVFVMETKYSYKILRKLILIYIYLYIYIRSLPPSTSSMKHGDNFFLPISNLENISRNRTIASNIFVVVVLVMNPLHWSNATLNANLTCTNLTSSLTDHPGVGPWHSPSSILTLKHNVV